MIDGFTIGKVLLICASLAAIPLGILIGALWRSPVETPDRALEFFDAAEGLYAAFCDAGPMGQMTRTGRQQKAMLQFEQALANWVDNPRALQSHTNEDSITDRFARQRAWIGQHKGGD